MMLLTLVFFLINLSFCSVILFSLVFFVLHCHTFTGPRVESRLPFPCESAPWSCELALIDSGQSGLALSISSLLPRNRS